MTRTLSRSHLIKLLPLLWLALLSRWPPTIWARSPESSTSAPLGQVSSSATKISSAAAATPLPVAQTAASTSTLAPASRPSDRATRKTMAQIGLTKRPTRFRYKLPSWFNYELYKRFYGKHYANAAENEARKRIYLRTALKVFEQRALYRAARTGSLSSVNELSDLTGDELQAFRGNRSRARKGSALEPSGCCSYDQVYRTIIGLLNRTSNAQEQQEADLALGRAFIHELEQKPLVDSAEPEAADAQPEVGVASESAREQPARTHRRPAHDKQHPPAEPDAEGRGLSAGQLSPTMLESVRRQIEEQLDSKSPFGRKMERMLSDYYEQPVQLRATIDSRANRPTSEQTASGSAGSKA